jgi:hypothetical protein
VAGGASGPGVRVGREAEPPLIRPRRAAKPRDVLRATPIRSRSNPGWVATASLATRAWPRVALTRVHSIFTVADLPAPFGPRNR